MPKWSDDSLNGMQRLFNQVMKTTDIYNTAGSYDDTRTIPSIHARHDVRRRVGSD